MICSKLYEFIKKCSDKMGCESTKCYSTAIYTTIMVVLSLQLLGTIEKQVFDFLGYMWAPIIGNFFQIICTILGIFGTYQYRPKFIAVYTTWSLVWLGWNIFVICLYLEVGVLNRNREIYILNIGTRNKSWWLDHGIGCKVSNDTWLNDIPKNTARVIPPEEYVEGCLLDYYYVEVIHAGVQCLLALTGFVFTCLAIYIYGEEPESCKYKVPPSTYISPKDYPSARYAPIEALQRARDSWCQPTYISYTDCMERARPKNCEKISDSNGNQSGVSVGQFQGTQSVINMENYLSSGHSNTEYQTGTRMRNCETGTTAEEQSMLFSSHAYNTGALRGNNHGEEYRMVSPV